MQLFVALSALFFALIASASHSSRSKSVAYAHRNIVSLNTLSVTFLFLHLYTTHKQKPQHSIAASGTGWPRVITHCILTNGAHLGQLGGSAPES